MRLDLFLKKTCIVPQRRLAKEICDGGAVQVNGRAAKAAQELRAGDVLRLLLPRRDLELRVLELPQGNVARRDAGRYVEVRRDVARDPVGTLFEGAAGEEDDDDNESDGPGTD